MSQFKSYPGPQLEPQEDSISYVMAIATLSGVTPPLVALATHHLLGAVAGHNSWVQGAAGEVVRPGFSLIVAGGDDPRWQRALELLVAPLLACQNRSREVSRICRPDVVRQHLVDQNKISDTLDLLGNSFISSPFGEGAKVSCNRRYDVLSKPLTLLEAPDHASYVAGMKAAMDREALILYRDGCLLEQALSRRPTEPASELVETLARAIDGCTEHVPDKNRAVDLCEMERTQVTLHVSASTQTVREALLSGRPSISRLLATCTIQPAKFFTGPLPVFARSQLTSGYDQWRQTVTDVFTARRNGGGMRFELDDAHHATLIEFNQELFTRLAEIPELLRGHFRPLFALPYRLMWGMMAVSRWGREVDTDIVMDITRQAFEQQKLALGDSAAENAVAQHAAFKDRVLEKLKLKSPCTRRTLVRCFTTQRIEIFEPVLKELADEQRIRCLDGLIEIVPDVPALQEAMSRP